MCRDSREVEQDEMPKHKTQTHNNMFSCCCEVHNNISISKVANKMQCTQQNEKKIQNIWDRLSELPLKTENCTSIKN